MSASSGWATSPGDRIVQRPAGQSATDRRPSSNAAASRAAFACPRPGVPASSTSDARASARRLSWRRTSASREVDRAPPSPAGPQHERDELRRREPAGPAQGEPLARALGGGQVTDGSRRAAVRRSVIRRVVRDRHGHTRIGRVAGTGPARRSRGDGGLGVPGARTTEARRFPPPSGPGNTPEPRDEPLPTAHRPLRRPFAPAGAGLRSGEGLLRERAGREEREHHLDAVERPVEPDRGVQGSAAEEHPAEGDAGRQQREEREQRPLRPDRERRVERVSTWASEKNRAPRMIAGAAAPRERYQAVVANPRKNSSSPIGAMIAAETRLNSSPPTSPAPGSGLGVRSRNDPRIRLRVIVTMSTGSESMAPMSSSRTADASGRRTRISAQLSAPGPTTSSRTTMT